MSELKSNNSNTKSITIATIIMMGSVLLSRVAGAFREMTLANLGGTSGDMDAYVAAFLIPELMNHFLAGGFLSITFIPMFQKYLSAGNSAAAWRSFSNLITVGSAAFVVALPTAMFFAPQLLSLTGMRHQDPETFALTVRLTRIILPAQILFYWGAFLMAAQYANKKFFLPAMSPLCYNLGIIFGGIFLSPHIGIEGFAWGVLIGAFAGNVLVQLPGAFAAGLKYNFIFNPRDPDFIHYIKVTIPLVAGLGMTFSNEIFFRFFASFLDSGAVASVNYALRTMMILVGVFGQASGAAIYPYLTKLAAENAYKEMSVMINNMLSRIAYFLLPLCAIMMVLAPQIIMILYEHGRFTPDSTAKTAPVLVMYLVGAFASSAAILAARPFYALQKTLLPMIVSTSVSLLSIPLYYALSKAMGASGIGLASALAMTAQFFVLFMTWGKRYGGFDSVYAWIFQLVKIVLASAIGAAVCHYLIGIIGDFAFFDNTRINTIIQCAIASLPSLVVVLGLYKIFGVSLKK